MSDPKHASSLTEAVANVLRVLTLAEHPVTNVSVWRFNESVGGGYGWRVVEKPPAISHGTDRPGQFKPTDYELLADQLLGDIERVTDDYRDKIAPTKDGS